MNDIWSSRKIELACKRDVNFMWLLEGFKAPNLAIVRKLAFQDLDECMYKILGDTLAYLEENPKDIDNATKDAFLYYRDLHMKRQS